MIFFDIKFGHVMPRGTINVELVFFFFVFFFVTPINLIILMGCTLYTPVCLQDEPICMRL